MIDDGAAAYWRLNETSGASAADSSGHGHAGTFSGIWWYSTAGAVPGDAGVTWWPNVQLGALPAMDASGTVEGWIKPNGSASNWFMRWTGGQDWTDDRVALYSQASDAKLHVAFSDGSTAQAGLELHCTTTTISFEGAPVPHAPLARTLA